MLQHHHTTSYLVQWKQRAFQHDFVVFLDRDSKPVDNTVPTQNVSAHVHAGEHTLGANLTWPEFQASPRCRCVGVFHSKTVSPARESERVHMHLQESCMQCNLPHKTNCICNDESKLVVVSACCRFGEQRPGEPEEVSNSERGHHTFPTLGPPSRHRAHEGLVS